MFPNSQFTQKYIQREKLDSKRKTLPENAHTNSIFPRKLNSYENRKNSKKKKKEHEFPLLGIAHSQTNSLIKSPKTPERESETEPKVQNFPRKRIHDQNFFPGN